MVGSRAYLNEGLRRAVQWFKTASWKKNCKKIPGDEIGVGSLRIGSLAKRLINRTLDANRLWYGNLAINSRIASPNCTAAVSAFFITKIWALQVALNAMKDVHGWKDGEGSRSRNHIHRDLERCHF